MCLDEHGCENKIATLRNTNCGHLKPILVVAGKVSTLDGDGMLIGPLPNATYEQSEIEPQQSDLRSILTDGIPKAENTAELEFGKARIGELLAKQADQPLENIIQIVTKGVACGFTIQRIGSPKMSPGESRLGQVRDGET